jgi:hypothetical protein
MIDACTIAKLLYEIRYNSKTYFLSKIFSTWNQNLIPDRTKFHLFVVHALELCMTLYNSLKFCQFLDSFYIERKGENGNLCAMPFGAVYDFYF